MFVLLFLYSSSVSVSAEKCYSCSSPHLQLRWPKDEETNRLQFLHEFPWYANESCDQIEGLADHLLDDCNGANQLYSLSPDIVVPRNKTDVLVVKMEHYGMIKDAEIMLHDRTDTQPSQDLLVRNRLPVVDCPNSVCIKAVITEPPAKREVCVQGSAIVRDCWSRVMGGSEANPFSLDPKALNNMVKLSEDEKAKRILGVIYTCRGYLCNASTTPSTLTLIALPLLLMFGAEAF